LLLHQGAPITPALSGWSWGRGAQGRLVDRQDLSADELSTGKTDHVAEFAEFAEFAGTDTEIEQLTVKIGDLRADSA
jgi:hypothetical protein